MNKNQKIIVAAAAILIIVTGCIFFNRNTSVKEQTKSTQQTQSTQQQQYYSDGTYYHIQQECPNRKRNMGSSKFTKRGCELNGEKPCPYCLPKTN